MYCPKCKGVELRQNDENLPFTCPKCGGLWLESHALPRMQELADFSSGGHQNPDHDHKTGLCPGGHGVLTRTKIEVEQPFYLEKCVQCNGIWFDKGEWQKVSESQFETNLLQLWSRAWQREKRREHQEQEITRLDKEALGEELYYEIIQLAGKISAHPCRSRAVGLFQEELAKMMSQVRRPTHAV
ncbi:zf-TFIIB domain-containing protein [Desulfopila sp. IMCC35008]|uniref:zf-TFIIB domain-containing protein n=1 Tax=Desulfopila sp. IMCC35008 TaxID=2653858 RepID=UPI0013D64A14|nr:zf-TFIIB domain-containing protein [Desulfopila sp. IMCC35008]